MNNEISSSDQQREKNPDEKYCESCGNLINARAVVCPKCGVPQRGQVSKAALLLLTFFLGGIGAHKFYTKRNWQGVLYLLFFWTYIPALIALVEFLIYVFTSEEKLRIKYDKSDSAVAIIVSLVIGLLILISILAAIAIPSYNAYITEANIYRVDEVLKTQVEAYYAVNKRLPESAEDLDLGVAAQYINNINIDNSGSITVTYSSVVEGQTLIYTPIVKNNSLSGWVCGNGTLEYEYRPQECN